jgi:hypothetical protein
MSRIAAARIPELSWQHSTEVLLEAYERALVVRRGS